MRIGSLFSGIGGLELGLERAGLGHTVWQVEQNPFCRRVLAKHWPNVERYNNVEEVGLYNLTPVDLICGGFPCQDLSSAGKGAGLAGERSGLWREFARIVDEMRPEWVVAENVASGAKRWVDAVVSDLGRLGYETLPVPVSARAVGAPHRRERVFTVAHAAGYGRKERITGGPTSSLASTQGASPGWAVTYTDREGQPAEPKHEQVGWLCSPTEDGGWEWRPPVSPVCGVDDGAPDRVDRLRALGNAVVPQCAEVVGWVIRELMGKS